MKCLQPNCSEDAQESGEVVDTIKIRTCKEGHRTGFDSKPREAEVTSLEGLQIAHKRSTSVAKIKNVLGHLINRKEAV